MSVIAAREELLDAMHRGISPTIPALEDFIEEVNDFLTLVNDYDEWESMRETATQDENGTHYSSEPGFSLVKLRKMLGYEGKG